MSNSLPANIKIGYLVILFTLLYLYTQSSITLSFKFLLSALTILGFAILFLHSALQRRSIVLYGAIGIFVFLYFFNLLFLVAGITNRNIFIFNLDEIVNIVPAASMLAVSCLLYLILTRLKGWNTNGEERITKIFMGFLLGLVITEKVIRISLPYFSNLVLSVVCFIVFSELVTISIRTLYPKEE
jgi:hypothetical protein